jgi:hypothetical protein
MKAILSTALAFLFGAAFQVHSQGYLVTNGVTYAGYFPPFFGSEMHVIQNPANGDYTAFFLIPASGDMFKFDHALDEGVRVFLVSLNDPVSLPAIQTSSYTEMLYPNSYVFDDGVLFYVGLYTGSTYPVNGVYSDPLFGWAQLVNNNGVIQLLDSALEYGGGGIITGTQTILPIPEPGTLGLLVLGGLLLAFQRHRR